MSDFERRNEFLTLDHETLSRLLQPAFPDRTLVSAEPLTDGQINSNYRIQLSGPHESFVLRIYVRERAALQKDLDLFHLVRGRVPVPEIVYVSPESVDFDHPYAVYRWVDGIPLGQLAQETASSRLLAATESAGEVLAEIHTLEFSESGFFGPQLSIPQPFGDGVDAFIDHMLNCIAGRAGERLGKPLTAQLLRFIEDHRSVLEVAKGKNTLLHADYNATNVLVSGESDAPSVEAILDWEFALSGPPLFDLANLHRHEEKMPNGFSQAFTRGYQRGGGALPERWKPAVKLLDLTNLCDFLDSELPRPHLHTDCRRLIQATLANWDRY